MSEDAGGRRDDSGVQKGGELEELGIGGGIRGRATLERGATIREGRKYIVSICEHRDKTIIL